MRWAISARRLRRANRIIKRNSRRCWRSGSRTSRPCCSASTGTVMPDRTWPSGRLHDRRRHTLTQRRAERPPRQNYHMLCRPDGDRLFPARRALPPGDLTRRYRRRGGPSPSSVFVATGRVRARPGCCRARSAELLSRRAPRMCGMDNPLLHDATPARLSFDPSRSTSSPAIRQVLEEKPGAACSNCSIPVRAAGWDGIVVPFETDAAPARAHLGRPLRGPSSQRRCQTATNCGPPTTRGLPLLTVSHRDRAERCAVPRP